MPLGLRQDMATQAVLKTQVLIGVAHWSTFKPVLEAALCRAINIQTRHRASGYAEVGGRRPGSSTQTECSPSQVTTEGIRYRGLFSHDRFYPPTVTQSP